MDWKRSTNRSEEGFSLVEMTVVLVIVGLLIGGVLMPLRTQMNQRSISETRQAMVEIREALVGFAIMNRTLPCPARPDIPAGATGAGLADCTQTFGVVPWVTLGLPETDPWGRRYSYRVSRNDDFTSPFAINSEGDMTVRYASAGEPIAENLPVIIVSHGKNGFNAWLPSGSRMTASADADENVNSGAGTDFVLKTPTADFDDLVTWIPLGVIMNRMVAAGRLP